MQKTVENWRKRIDMVFYFSTAQAVSEISKILPPPPPCCRTASVSPWQPKDFTPNKLWGYIYIDLPIKTGIWPIKMRTQWNVMFNQSELELLVKLAYSNQSAWGYLPHASGKQHYIYNITILYIYIYIIYNIAWETNLKTMTFGTNFENLPENHCLLMLTLTQTHHKREQKKILRYQSICGPPILDIGTWHTCLRLINLPIFPTAIPMMSLLFVACIMLNSFKFQFGSVWCVQILFGLIHVNSNFCHTQMNTHRNELPKYTSKVFAIDIYWLQMNCNSFVIQIPIFCGANPGHPTPALASPVPPVMWDEVWCYQSLGILKYGWKIPCVGLSAKIAFNKYD